jgi:hypothetical protein
MDKTQTLRYEREPLQGQTNRSSGTSPAHNAKDTMLDSAKLVYINISFSFMKSDLSVINLNTVHELFLMPTLSITVTFLLSLIPVMLRLS